jgi:hypothetical protein
VARRMIDRGFDGFGRVGRVLHPQRLEQFLTEDRISVGDARSLRHNAASQQVGDVGVGEARPEA